MDSTLLKGLTMLEVLARSDRPRGITELAEELGWGKSNVHRVVQTLVHAGFVRKEPASGRYEGTLRLWELGTLVFERLDIRAYSLAQAKNLAELSGESTHISRLEGIEVLYIEKIDGDHPVRAYTRIGGRAPAACVATGKAMLAHAQPSVIEQAIDAQQAYTSRTITDAEKFLEEMKQIRENGYAINRGEWRDGVVGVASPILDSIGQPIAALGISGPADRLPLRRLKELATATIRAAQDIERDLGFDARAATGG